MDRQELHLSIDELAREARTTVRNVRSYQSKGLLPPSRREGRRNVYTADHVDRLRMIANLLERGYTLSSIAELLGALARGDEVSDLLGLEEAITEPWLDEEPLPVTLSQLAEWFGPNLSQSDIERSLELDLIRYEGADLTAPSPQLLQVGRVLVGAGIPLSELHEQIDALRRDARNISRRFVQLIAKGVFDQYGEGKLPPPEERPRLTEFIKKVRPMAKTAVEVELARALEEVIHQELGVRLGAILNDR
ncbi:MAG: MerR family transcriptional regulator [Myxococcales bacterium]|nr:MerR family transcriptional regulator [Myxococcales bacterium]